ncbi:unnamed protein product [Rhizoctonia solani]|uniref:Protein kinase domain-containing protein n=1 Tax=Rhizoctonia solani TaxID=456999 RepID=A0A8H3DZN6_9AGAM|nr:unnamed protein product [Rhizoctonia solani]
MGYAASTGATTLEEAERVWNAVDEFGNPPTNGQAEAKSKLRERLQPSTPNPAFGTKTTPTSTFGSPQPTQSSVFNASSLVKPGIGAIDSNTDSGAFGGGGANNSFGGSISQSQPDAFGGSTSHPSAFGAPAAIGWLSTPGAPLNVHSHVSLLPPGVFTAQTTGSAFGPSMGDTSLGQPGFGAKPAFGQSGFGSPPTTSAFGSWAAAPAFDQPAFGTSVVQDDDFGPQMVTSEMSTQQILECLCRAGCIDLSSQMSSRQETAMIVSGGGFGDIWKGQLHSGAKVAIKAWRTTATLGRCEYKTLKRAARELYTWSKMNHPHIHRLQGVILFRDQYLGMVSQWMDNGNLHEYLRKHPDADRCQLCTHVASGLKYMHNHNTIHGDLKAINVLVSSDGIARISDFDSAIISEVSSSVVFSVSSSNSRPATMRWAAPELLSEQPQSKTMQSDVYALGMVGIAYQG